MSISHSNVILDRPIKTVKRINTFKYDTTETGMVLFNYYKHPLTPNLYARHVKQTTL